MFVQNRSGSQSLASKTQSRPIDGPSYNTAGAITHEQDAANYRASFGQRK